MKTDNEIAAIRDLIAGISVTLMQLSSRVSDVSETVEVIARKAQELELLSLQVKSKLKA